MKSLKKALAIFLATVMALGVMSVSAFADEETVVEGTPVSFVGITVEAPVDGYYADCVYDLDSDEYELVDLMWEDAVTGELLYSTVEGAEVVDKAFEAGSVYTVSVALYAADGYVFELDAENLVVSVNGYVAEIEEISEAGKLLIVSCDFECMADGADIGGDDNGNTTGNAFNQVLNFLKSLVVSFIRLIGTLFGIK